MTGTLKGAVQMIRQSKPIFTTEVRVYKDEAFTDELMEFISDLGYDSYVINEECGGLPQPAQHTKIKEC
jgi:hypothetical protein